MRSSLLPTRLIASMCRLPHQMLSRVSAGSGRYCRPAGLRGLTMLLLLEDPPAAVSPSGVAYWLWRTLKAITGAATTSVCRTSCAIGRMLPTAGIGRRIPMSPGQSHESLPNLTCSRLVPKLLFTRNKLRTIWLNNIMSSCARSNDTKVPHITTF